MSMSLTVQQLRSGLLSCGGSEIEGIGIIFHDLLSLGPRVVGYSTRLRPVHLRV